jgi:hypothetical protein
VKNRSSCIHYITAKLVSKSVRIACWLLSRKLIAVTSHKLITINIRLRDYLSLSCFCVVYKQTPPVQSVRLSFPMRRLNPFSASKTHGLAQGNSVATSPVPRNIFWFVSISAPIDSMCVIIAPPIIALLQRRLYTRYALLFASSLYHTPMHH